VAAVPTIAYSVLEQLFPIVAAAVAAAESTDNLTGSVVEMDDVE